MARYHNQRETVKVGQRIRNFRVDALLSIDDIAHKTGFSKSTISKIENGSNADLSHIIEIAKAIGVQPKNFFDIDFVLKSRYSLPRNREQQKHLTVRIAKFIDSGFFREAKFVREILLQLKEEFNIKANGVVVSVTLRRFVENGKLKVKKVGRQNQYYSK